MEVKILFRMDLFVNHSRKKANANHEDNIILYFDSGESVVHQFTKRFYDNQYKIYLIRVPP